MLPGGHRELADVRGMKTAFYFLFSRRKGIVVWGKEQILIPDPASCYDSTTAELEAKGSRF